ncbi:MFS transporter [Paenibacillus taichungensis]|uniref:MFS transporter n=1 Tax=Paenibacillus taichungensis TaxID=484184 RepID=UPI0035E2CB6A
MSVPAGTLIASMFNWRIAFIASAVLGILVLLIQILWLPKLTTENALGLSVFFGVLRNRKLHIVLLYSIFAFGGHFASYTFVTPFFQQIIVFSTLAISILMLAYGIMGVLGNLLGGITTSRNSRGTQITVTILFSVALLTLALFGQFQIVASGALLLWALAFGIIPLSAQLWVQYTSPEAPEGAQAMATAITQLAISLGALVGGVAVDNMGLKADTALGAILGIVALGMIFVAREDKKEIKASN